LRPRALDAARVALLIVAALLYSFLAIDLSIHWSSDRVLARDFYAFWDVGRAALNGDLDRIYGAPHGGFAFLHPPFAIALFAPLGALDARAAFVVIASTGVLALSFSALALRRIAPRTAEQDLVWLSAIASPACALALDFGQIAPLLLAAWLAGLWLHARDRTIAAGLAWSLLLLKPHFAIAPLAMLLVRRDGSALGMSAGAVALVLISLPFGLARWPEWIAAVTRAFSAPDHAALFKQNTWLAFSRGVAPEPIAIAMWLLIAVPLAFSVLRAVRSEGSMLRNAGLLALATVALGPFAHYYDALLLTLPLAALWLERDRYTRTFFALSACAAAAVFVCQYILLFVVQRGPAVAGLLATIWLAIELASRPQRTIGFEKSIGTRMRIRSSSGARSAGSGENGTTSRIAASAARSRSSKPLSRTRLGWVARLPSRRTTIS
jgi:hypothetical protein